MADWRRLKAKSGVFFRESRQGAESSILSASSRKRYIPYAVPNWGRREHLAIGRCLLTGRLVDGPDIAALLESVRTLTGAPFVFGFDSGETAIRVCLKAFGIGPGDAVIMPSFCCHSVASAVLGCGANPVFCDVQHDLNPDVASILALLTANTRAIIFPHLFGRPADVRGLEDRLARRGLRDRILLIDDAAQSFGAQIGGRYLGTFGDAGIISFGAGKMTAASGGGLLLTRSETLSRRIEGVETGKTHFARKMQELIYWFVFRRWRKYTRPLYRYLQFMFRSARSPDDPPRRISNVDAAIVMAQIPYLDASIRRRCENKHRFDQALEELKRELNLPIETFGLLPTGWYESCTKYIFKCDFQALPNSDTIKFYDYFGRAGIELQPLYALLHLQPEFNVCNHRLPGSERQAISAFNLPTDPTLRAGDIEHIRNTLSSFFHMCHPGRLPV